jgi:hypothetical protein
MNVLKKLNDEYLVKIIKRFRYVIINIIFFYSLFYLFIDIYNN